MIYNPNKKIIQMQNQQKRLKFPRVTDHFGPFLSIQSFTFLQKLGKGTFGYVSLYKHIESNTNYAIKKIKYIREGKNKTPPEEIQMLTRKELEILYKIDNPHIIKLLDHFQDGQAVYLITQFIQGANLYDLTLKNSTHLELQTIAEIVYQICSGLEELHTHHIIHRDIKLENIMWHRQFVKIVDLGCSNFYSQGISRQTTIGTRLYWSPEIIAQEEQNDRLDIWCLGVVLYQLVFLDQPFSGNDIERKIRKCQYSFPSDNRPEADLEDLFKRIFVGKNQRISAARLKEHPWIKKYRKDKEIVRFKFEQCFTEEETKKYRELLRDGVAENIRFLEQLKTKTQKFEGWLKESRKQLRKK